MKNLLPKRSGKIESILGERESYGPSRQVQKKEGLT
jgi:hypothetical protein